jgi:hypothetical protein
MINHFHSSQSGCKIKTYYKRKHFNLFRDYTKCLTHNKIICRCGWERGWEQGSCSKDLWKKGKQDLTHLLDSSKMKLEV